MRYNSNVNIFLLLITPLLHTLHPPTYIHLEMFDRTRSGTLNITEFAELFKYINQWKATFEGIDKDRSGFIEFNELTQGK